MSLVMLMVLVVAVSDLVFTVKIWKASRGMKMEVQIPRGSAVPEPPVPSDNVDLNELVSQVVGAMNEHASEAGEELPQVGADEVAKAMSALGLGGKS